MLSRAGWNNVVIFSMLLMIFFLNGLHHKLFKEADSFPVLPVLPESSFILAAALPGVKVERIGTSWRSEGIWQTTATDIETWLVAWTSTTLQTIDKPQNLPEPSSAIQFWLAGQELPWVVTLYQQGNTPFFYDKQRQVWFSPTPEQVNQFFKPIYANTRMAESSAITSEQSE
ncbi:hypothetical protein NI389_08260 [Pseudoalteromonas xiamenensis]|uniref:hypothetical protein n=1 Tax=Pseudoalteromonas xiamenensis TaxID=882626 RepID=UPI0027E4B25D|nr:hypothetical protein [Pseudoalteromonas xiamenensis]WMN61359.1 hypothetical protein NI389_08260 [Pseudoalteromonas xiamenensis]